MRVRIEVMPFILVAACVGALAGVMLGDVVSGGLVFLLGTLYLLYFFRDPERIPPSDPSAVLAGADGRVMSVKRLMEPGYLKAESVRISTFLSAFDVHINRAPLTGQAKFIGYFPGKKHFAFREKSSEFNQHNKILIESAQTRCLVAQIVGPLARRVVYWLDQAKPAPVRAGDRIGMMKFGSRLDVYLPDADVDVFVRKGDTVRAGETVIARVREKS